MIPNPPQSTRLRVAYGLWYWKTELAKIQLIALARFRSGSQKGKIEKNPRETP